MQIIRHLQAKIKARFNNNNKNHYSHMIDHSNSSFKIANLVVAYIWALYNVQAIAYKTNKSCFGPSIERS